MNREITNNLKNFDKVWERVSGVPVNKETVRPAKGEDEERLRRFIVDTAAAAESYRILAQRTKGEQAKQLMTMAAAERKILGRMQMEFFLLTGDTLAMPKRKAAQEGVLSQLRRCYMNENIVYRACMAAARQTESENLRLLHKDSAALAAAHQKSLRAMIGRAMG